MNPILLSTPRAAAALVLVAITARAHAQSFNVDVGSNVAFPTPAAAYGAAAAQPGHWNAVSGVPGPAVALLDLAANGTAVTLAVVGGAGNVSANNAGTAGDDEDLMDDFQNVGGAGAATTWTFTGLEIGQYVVWTYAWAPDDESYLSNVAIDCSSDASQVVGGFWAPWDVNSTHAQQFVQVNTGTLVVSVTTADTFGTVNGFQLRKNPMVGIPYCFGDGSGTPCPGACFGAGGHGCRNSFHTVGGLLTANGTPSVSNDRFALTAAFLPPTTSVLFFQGTDVAAFGLGIGSGDGLLCVGGDLIRLAVKTAACGQATYPDVFDAPISVRGAIPATVASTRFYQGYYRNAAAGHCTPFLYNFTQGVQVTWAP